jgi:molybdopterin/thiamine biosynthesis adenylyltransferase
MTNLSPAEVTRYLRQITLEGWGREAQERLKSSCVLIAGAGGLGCAAALHLLAGGVGSLCLADESRISLSDLSHQFLFREKDLGKAKVTVAERRLQEINPFVQVESRVKNVSEHNVSRLAAGRHLLIDVTNDAGTRFLLNKAAARSRTPLVYAWVQGMNGCLSTSWPSLGPCVACAPLEGCQPGPPALLGPLKGILGSLVALEALRILGGLGPALLGRRLLFQGRQLQITDQPIHADPHCPVCHRLPPLESPKGFLKAALQRQ